MNPFSSLIPLLTVLSFQDPQGTADVHGPRWHQLTQDAEVEEEKLPVPFAAKRSVVVDPVEGGVEVRARWSVRALRPGWFSGALLRTAGTGVRVRSVKWNGKAAAYSSEAAGTTVFGYADKDATVELIAFVPGEPTRKPVELSLLPAVVGEVRVARTGDLQPTLQDRATGLSLFGRNGVFSTGVASLDLELVDPKAEGGVDERPDLVMARTGLGLTVGEGELRARARVVWEIRHGELSEVSVRATGLGDDLTVEGPNVREWKLDGDRIEIALQEPDQHRVDVEIRWTASVSKATESTLALPRLEPQGVFRSEASVQLARDGEVEVVPRLDEWKAIASSQLPDWGAGLVEGTATASFATSVAAGGELNLFRFVPVEGPPVVVDVAAYQVASSREGRTLMRAHYEVRNERAAHLRVSPPVGTRIIGARVGTEPALPTRDEDGSWLIPLQRSVETVDGTLSFPVEVILMGEDQAWRRREKRRLALPVLDAPVAVSRLTLYLPPGYESRLEAGEAGVVGAFTEGEGITYGLGVGDVGAGQADALFQGAVDAWLDNDFQRAQDQLDELKEMGASNENIDKLQANLQVVRGEETDKKVDVAMERRIKEQAKARAKEDIAEEREASKQAEEYRRAGDYVAAKREYERALELGRRIEMLEQTESVEQKTRNIAVADKLEALEKDVERQKREIHQSRSNISGKKRTKNARKGKAKSGGASTSTPVATPVGASGPGPSPDATVVYDFEDDGIEGELLEPTSGLDTDTTGIASRSRARHSATIDLESLDQVPVTPESSRDFSATVDVAPTAQADSRATGEETTHGIVLQGTTAAPEPEPLEEEEEAVYELEGMNVDVGAEPAMRRVAGISLGGAVARGRARRAERRATRGARGGRGATGAGGGGFKQVVRPKPSFGHVAGAQTAELPPAAPAPPADPNVGDEEFRIEGRVDKPAEALPPEILPEPEVHASGLSVVIPSAGEAVLYQRLLLAESATFEVDVDAREPLRERMNR